MLIHTGFELYYTLFPLLFQVVSFPLRLFAVFNSPWELVGLDVTILIAYLVLPPLGIAFIYHMGSKLRRRHNQLPAMPLKSWLSVLLLFSIGLVVVGYFARESFIIQSVALPGLVLAYYSLGIIGLGSLFYYVFNYSLQILFRRIHVLQKNKVARRLFFGLILSLALYPFLLAIVLLMWLVVSPLGNPQASRFFVINAAIKNTCFIDPQRANCPQSLNEISYIEPQRFVEMMNGNQVNYVYYPETNQYSLVVRYSPLRAVVFDWRLTEKYGIDLHEYQVNLIGQDRLKDPPPYPGPWTFEEWEYGQ